MTAAFDPQRWERAQRNADRTLRGLPPDDEPIANGANGFHADVPPEDGAPPQTEIPEHFDETRKISTYRNSSASERQQSAIGQIF